MGLFSKKKPQVQPVAPIPDENDPSVIRQKRLSMMQAAQGSGRQSTIMSKGASDNLGDTTSALQ